MKQPYHSGSDKFFYCPETTELSQLYTLETLDQRNEETIFQFQQFFMFNFLTLFDNLDNFEQVLILTFDVEITSCKPL